MESTGCLQEARGPDGERSAELVLGLKVSESVGVGIGESTRFGIEVVFEYRLLSY